MIKNNVGLKFALLVLFITHLVLLYTTKSAGVVFNVSAIVIYVVVNIIYFKNRIGKTIFSFELLFAISYFLSCFLLFVIDISSNIVTTYYQIDEYHKWKFLNISMAGYYAYMYGLCLRPNLDSHMTKTPPYINSSLISVFNFLTSLFIVFFILKGGFSVLERYTGNDDNFYSYGGLLSYLTIFHTMSSMAVIIRIGTKKVFLSDTKTLHYLFNSIILLGLYFISGYRSQFLQLFIPIIFLYLIYIKAISNIRILLYLVIGMVLMVFVGILRGGGEYSGGGGSAYFLRDFVVEDIAGVWLIDHTDSHGITGGSNAILQIISVVPFLGGFVLSLYGANAFALPSARAFTYEFVDNGSGLGTNMVGDLYYTFGLVGVIICMFLMGVLIRRLTNYKSMYGLLCYLLMCGNAVFATRVEFFFMVRKLALSIMILYIIKMLLGDKKSHV